MRLWHKNLLSVLPKQQLIAQWRECCAIAKNIQEKGTPNHILVNKITNYPLGHFYSYSLFVKTEMDRRKYKCEWERFNKYFSIPENEKFYNYLDIFPDWHNKIYLDQCYYNLQEKWDCGGIPDDEWFKLHKLYMELKELN